MNENSPVPVRILRGAPDAALLAGITALARAAEDADGNPPLSEQTLVDLRAAEAGQLMVFTAGAPEAGATAGLAGVAVLTGAEDASGGPAVLELVVHPGYRGQGVGTALADAVRGALDGAPAPRAWSHGNHEAAVELAARYGLRPVRELWKMRLGHQAPDHPLPSAALPAGVSLRAFEPGRDEEAWLAANAAAFAHHPEQGRMTLADLQARMAEDWFDPAGFLLAVRESDGALLGFHWTKVHAGTNGQPDLGEVYAVGVVPEAQGMGLGRALTLAGIEHLHRAGLEAIMLYVDADNTAAVALYRRLGFVRWDADVMYAAGEVPSL